MFTRRLSTACVLLGLLSGAAYAADVEPLGAEIKAPDDKPADLNKPVQVFLIMGQSNAVGMGHIEGNKGETLEKSVKEDKAYPFLIDKEGKWTERKDVRYTQVMVGKKGGGPSVLHNEWMTVKGKTMGIEYGVGHKLGNSLDAPVLILKSCIGNRALGWDLLPPGSERADYEMIDKKSKEKKAFTYAGYKDFAEKWEKGTPAPTAGGWYAGKQYDDDVANAKMVLEQLDTYYPGAKGYEVAGFFWWQGERDCGDEGHAAMYEKNLVNLIKSLRKDFNAPNAKFVMATLGEAEKGTTGNEGLVLNAMLACDGDSGKHPEFKGNVATVYTHDMARGGSGNAHYGGNCKVYMDVGLSMGDAMSKLLGK